MGQAKSRAARALSDAGLVTPGGVWATRMHMRRIAGEAHLREAVVYIEAHGEDGREAAVWRDSAVGRTGNGVARDARSH